MNDLASFARLLMSYRDKVHCLASLESVVTLFNNEPSAKICIVLGERSVLRLLAQSLYHLGRVIGPRALSLANPVKNTPFLVSLNFFILLVCFNI